MTIGDLFTWFLDLEIAAIAKFVGIAIVCFVLAVGAFYVWAAFIAGISDMTDRRRS